MSSPCKPCSAIGSLSWQSKVTLSRTLRTTTTPGSFQKIGDPNQLRFLSSRAWSCASPRMCASRMDMSTACAAKWNNSMRMATAVCSVWSLRTASGCPSRCGLTCTRPMFATSPCAWVTAVQSTKHKEANTNMLLCGSVSGSCQQLHTLPCRVLLGWKISCWVASLPRSISCPPTTHIQVWVLHDINYSNKRKPSYPDRREKRATTAG